jgi:hypothetical protein
MGRGSDLLLPLLLLGTSTLAAEPVSEPRLLEAQAFLVEYAALSQSQSPEFFELYSDRAVIRTRAEGRANDTKFEGRAYKAWSRELLLARRISIDASEFHEVMVEERGGRLLIRAKRLSQGHCFWDADYQVALMREAAGLKIIDERITTAPARDCPVSPGVLVADRGPEVTMFSSTPNASGWHPLSQEQVARSAMQLAQELSARNHDRPKSAPVASTLPPAPAVTRIADPASVLVTPSAD